MVNENSSKPAKAYNGSGLDRPAPLPVRLLRKIGQGPEGWRDIARAIIWRVYKLFGLQGSKSFQQSKVSTKQIEFIRSLSPFHLYVPFAQAAERDAADYAADVYVAHGVQAIPAADAIAMTSGGKVVCDCIEIPSFALRALPSNWSKINTRFIDYSFEGYLRHCDSIVTIGWELAKELETYGRPVNVIPNYRYAETLEPSDKLRENCGIGPDTPLVLAISIITSGMEAVIKGVAQIPEPVHLALMGHLRPEEYRERCEQLVEDVGLTGRVHFFDPVPYDELTSTASAADVGLIVRDPAVPNNHVSLPNRIFDYLFSGVPVVTPNIPDIARILRAENAGVVMEGIEPKDWRHGIAQALEHSAEMKRNALAASKKLVWETLERRLFEDLGRPQSVTFVGYTDLNKNNRTMRMAESLRKMGVTVKIYSRSIG